MRQLDVLLRNSKMLKRFCAICKKFTPSKKIGQSYICNQCITKHTINVVVDPKTNRDLEQLEVVEPITWHMLEECIKEIKTTGPDFQKLSKLFEEHIGKAY